MASSLPPQATITTTNSASEEDPPSYFVETALEWFERCELLRQQEQQQRQIPNNEPPTSPSAAAWAFFRGSACLYGGTGNPFVDEALHRQHHPWNKLPIVEIKDRHGSSMTGKTHTLVSLAAKFVVATRARLFPQATTCSTNKAPWTSSIHHKQQIPQVIILDSTLGITTLRLIQAISTQLMLHRTVAAQNDLDLTNDAFIQHQLVETDRDMEDCLSRIHIAHVDDDREWIPVLEALRHELGKSPGDTPNEMTESVLVVVGDDEKNKSDVPTLLLWDGFLVGNPGMTPGLEKEISRQLALLLQDCTIGFICTTSACTKTASRMQVHHSPMEDLLQDYTFSSTGRRQPTPFDIRTIILENDVQQESTHGFLATVVDGNQKIPYSLSSAGVLP